MAKKPKKNAIPRFRLRFSDSKICHWADRYNFEEDDDVPSGVGDFARSNGYLDRDQLFTICEWKSNRSKYHVNKNGGLSVKEITRFAFSTPDEYARITSLTTLHGVSWPTASVILHFCVDSRYPILDVRALWSLGVNKPKGLLPYKFDLWWEYVRVCREIAQRKKVAVRYLDKAMWQYSREKQKKL